MFLACVLHVVDFMRQSDASVDDEDASLDDEEDNDSLVTHKKYFGAKVHAHRALVVDSAYRPVNVISWSKAVMMDVAEKVCT